MCKQKNKLFVMPRLHNTCRFNEVPNETLVQKYCCVVKVTQNNIVFEVNRQTQDSLLKIADKNFAF